MDPGFKEIHHTVGNGTDLSPGGFPAVSTTGRPLFADPSTFTNITRKLFSREVRMEQFISDYGQNVNQNRIIWYPSNDASPIILIIKMYDKQYSVYVAYDGKMRPATVYTVSDPDTRHIIEGKGAKILKPWTAAVMPTQIDTSRGIIMVAQWETAILMDPLQFYPIELMVDGKHKAVGKVYILEGQSSSISYDSDGGGGGNVSIMMLRNLLIDRHGHQWTQINHSSSGMNKDIDSFMYDLGSLSDMERACIIQSLWIHGASEKLLPVGINVFVAGPVILDVILLHSDGPSPRMSRVATISGPASLLQPFDANATSDLVIKTMSGPVERAAGFETVPDEGASLANVIRLWTADDNTFANLTLKGSDNNNNKNIVSLNILRATASTMGGLPFCYLVQCEGKVANDIMIGNASKNKLYMDAEIVPDVQEITEEQRKTMRIMQPSSGKGEVTHYFSYAIPYTIWGNAKVIRDLKTFMNKSADVRDYTFSSLVVVHSCSFKYDLVQHAVLSASTSRKQIGIEQFASIPPGEKGERIYVAYSAYDSFFNDFLAHGNIEEPRTPYIKDGGFMGAIGDAGTYDPSSSSGPMMSFERYKTAFDSVRNVYSPSRGDAIHHPLLQFMALGQMYEFEKDQDMNSLDLPKTLEYVQDNFKTTSKVGVTRLVLKNQSNGSIETVKPGDVSPMIRSTMDFSGRRRADYDELGQSPVDTLKMILVMIKNSVGSVDTYVEGDHLYHIRKVAMFSYRNELFDPVILFRSTCAMLHLVKDIQIAMRVLVALSVLLNSKNGTSIGKNIVSSAMNVIDWYGLEYIKKSRGTDRDNVVKSIDQFLGDEKEKRKPKEAIDIISGWKSSRSLKRKKIRCKIDFSSRK